MPSKEKRTTVVVILNRIPVVFGVKATQPDYCKFGPSAIITWKYSDPDDGPTPDKQSAYQLQMDNNANFNSPEIDTGKVPSSGTSYSISSGLQFGQKYHIRVYVWDSHDAKSNPSTINFTTPAHSAPVVDFTPVEIVVDESTQFNGTALGPSPILSWDWDFGCKAGGSKPQCLKKTFKVQNPLNTFFV